MKLTKKLEAEVKQAYHAFWKSLLSVDMKTFNALLDDDFRQIGTTEAEMFFNKKAVAKYLKAAKDQIVGNIELRNPKLKIESLDKYVLITDLSDCFVKIDNKWTFYARCRSSFLLHNTKAGWKFIQQHTSMPDHRTEEGETIALEKVAKENLELRDAIKRRTVELEQKNRELEIETSLERVRAVAMGMKKPDDTLDICKIMFTELQALGFTDLRNTLINFWDDANDSLIDYDYSDYTGGNKAKLPYFSHPIFEQFQKKIKKSKDAFAKLVVKKEELESWKQRRRDSGEYEDPRLNNIPALYYFFYSIGSGAIGISTFSSLTTEKIDLLKRFRNVFDFAYRRYMDVAQAEAQAKEAQIELALERVRAGAMAMRQSAELGKLIFVLYQELTKLDAQLDRCFIMIVHPENRGITWWLAGKEGLLAENGFFIQENQHPSHLMYLDGWQQRKKKWQYLFEGKEKKDWDRFGFNKTELAKLPEFIKQDMAGMKKVHLSGSSDTFGSLVTGSLAPLEEEHQDIISRFTIVFNQAYTRFLDLQKAEAQAREAKIETALERVRSRTMGMQQSNELPEAANLLFKQVESLGMPAWSAGYCIWDDDKQGITLWMSSEAVMQPSFHAPLTKDPSFIHMREAYEKGQTFHVEEVGGKALEKHYKYMRTLPVVGDVLDSIIEAGHPLPTFQIFHCVYFSQGFLLFITYEPVPDAHEIFKRFGKVFDQTYTRFLDLQRAEAQAKEAQIELALERVRARTMAMKQSDELREVVMTIYEQLQHLDFNANACNIVIADKLTSNREFWIAGFAKEQYPESYRVPYFNHPYADAQLTAWRNGEVYSVFEYVGEMKKTYDDIFFTKTDFKNVPAEAKATMIALPSVKFSTAFFSHGYLQALSKEQLTDQNAGILQRFAKVFEQTYIRFLDLQKAEAQSREAQIELGLERVRARAMAIQKSDELSELVDTVFKELTKLDFALNWCIINIIDEPSLTNMVWAANPETNKPPESYLMKFEDYPFHHSMMKGYQERKTKHVYVIEGKEKKTYDEYLFNKTEWRRVHKAAQDASRAMKRYVATFTFSNFGGLQTVGEEYLSEENLDILSRFGKVFDLTYTRFNDLKNAEAQAREAQIETGLERVRAKAMSMFNSADLMATAGIIFTELKKLGINSIRSGIGFLNKKTREVKLYSAIASGQQESLSLAGSAILDHHPVLKEIYDRWIREDQYYPVLKGESLISYYEQLIANFKVPAEQTQIEQFGYFIPVKQGMFYGWAENPFTDSDKLILKRFASVVDLTFKRYFDLKNAEANAREAQIEAALERVRSRSMGMQKSDELQEVIKLVYQQLIHLNINLDHAGFVVDYKPKGDWTFWIADEQDIPSKISHPYFDSVWAIQFNEAKEKGADYFATHLNVEEKNKFYNELLSYVPDLPKASKDFYLNCPGLAASTVLFDNVSLYIENFSGTPYTDEENTMLMRFGKVFQQTYTRFLDLQKAEAQAKEAQIETALERVRSRTNAMHYSGHLHDVITEIYTQLHQLGFRFDSADFMTDYTPDGFTIWLAAEHEGIPPSIHVPAADHRIFRLVMETVKRGDEFFTFLLQHEEKNKYFKHIFESTGLKKIPEDQKQKIYDADGMAASCVVLKNIIFTIANFKSIPYTNGENDIIRRVAYVFQQSYTRFLDLQKAEAQAREAQVETALERVRGKVMAMHSSEDLAITVDAFFTELKSLHVMPRRCGVTLIDEESRIADLTVTTATQGGESKKLIAKLKLSGHPVLDAVFDNWKLQQEFHPVLKGDEIKEYYKVMNPQVAFPDFAEDEKQYGHYFFFKEGGVFAWTDTKLEEDELKIFRRFTTVLSLTYKRYKDLQQAEELAKQAELDLIKLKEEKQKTENALAELQTTQKQLIQSEKMASLGELTAGIAHEIQNPLNFVNNFSEVSTELVDEMNEEIDKGNLTDAKEIANDLKQNLKKINHHGKRAGDIVKGMLQHSRSSSGVKESTDINALADEYLRLAYHGLRAKDKSFNATMKTDFDESIGNINIIPQDIGRVILNLITNAFYVVNEKKNQGLENYEPTVTVKTLKNPPSGGRGAEVVISVKDNGNGIPQNVLDKIFQPFFTTKPTGQGTGLGLSLSYDIIKAQGGELIVETKEGEGAEFKIILPL